MNKALDVLYGFGIALILVVFTGIGLLLGASTMNEEVIIIGGALGFLLAILVIFGIWWVFFKR